MFSDAVLAFCVLCNIKSVSLEHILCHCAGAGAPVLPVQESLRLVLSVVNSIFVFSGFLQCIYALPKF